MIPWLWVSVAWADPVAMRAPISTLGATLGLHDASVGVPVADGPWLAASLATNGASAGASIGTRWVLGDAARTRVLQAGVSGGLLVPLVEPGLALTGTPWIHGGWIGRDASFVAGAAAPLAVGSGGLRLPLLFELQSGFRIGPVAVGGRLAAGPVFTPGTDLSTWLEPALTLQLARPEAD